MEQIDSTLTPAQELSICSVLCTRSKHESMHFPATLKTEQIDVETKALIDSGANKLFIHEELVDKYKILVLPLDEPISVKNVNGTENKRGEVTHFTWIPMRIGDYEEQHRFYVSNLGKDHLILGLPWLEKVNPIIDWTERTTEIRKERIQRSLALKRTLKLTN